MPTHKTLPTNKHEKEDKKPLRPKTFVWEFSPQINMFFIVLSWLLLLRHYTLTPAFLSVTKLNLYMGLAVVLFSLFVVIFQKFKHLQYKFIIPNLILLAVLYFLTTG